MMKKSLSLLAIIILSSIAVMAQTSPNYSGDWELNKSKSQLGSLSQIDSLIYRIKQDEKEIQIVKELTVNGQQLSGPISIYAFDNKPNVSTVPPLVVQGEILKGEGTVTKVGRFEDGKYLYSSTTTRNNPQGKEITKSKVEWILSSDGNSMTIKEEKETPAGKESTEMFFTKIKK